MGIKKRLSARKGTLLDGVMAFHGRDHDVHRGFMDWAAPHWGYGHRKNFSDELDRCPRGKTEKVLTLENPGDTVVRHGQAYREYVRWLSILTRVYGIPLRYFEGAEEVISEDLIEEGEGEFDVLSVSKKLEKAYEAIRRGPYNALKTRLWIYDYLERQWHKNGSLKAYLENDQRYFEKIHRTFEASPLTFAYMRMLSLPLDYDYSSKSPKDIMRDAIDLCSFPLFKHICDFIYDFGSLLNRQNSPVGFFVAGRKYINAHYALINEGQYVVKEDFCYDHTNTLQPDLMYIDKESHPTSVIFKRYKKQITELLNEPTTLILNDLGQIYSCVKELHENLVKGGNLESLSSVEYQAHQKHLEITERKLEYIQSIVASMN